MEYLIQKIDPKIILFLRLENAQELKQVWKNDSNALDIDPIYEKSKMSGTMTLQWLK